MGTSAEEILDELESHVISCDNTVTYKWISQKWNVHVNTAKQLLHSFLDKEKSKKNPVSFEVVYFLSGPQKNSDEEISYRVCLVREKDLVKTKSRFQKIVSEHVYSIQKSTLKDLHALYVIDKANGKEILEGNCGKSAVKCEDAVPRSAELLASAAISTSRNNDKEKNSYDRNCQKPSQVDIHSFNSDTSNLNDRNSAKEAALQNGKTKKDGPKGIAGMFAAQSGKNTIKKAEGENVTSSNRINKKQVGKKNGIATLFAKQAERPPAQKAKKEEEQLKKAEDPRREAEEQVLLENEDPFASEDEEEVRKCLPTCESDNEDRSESPVERKGKGKESDKKNAPKEEKRKKKSKYPDGEEESPLPTKKRKRIKMMSSSGESSEEEMEVGESESPIPLTPKESSAKEVAGDDDDDDDIIPATPQEAQNVPAGKKRMRKRVLVNRTFADERGFIVTKKEYAFESCSDDSSQSCDEAKSSKNKESTVPNGRLNHKKESSGDKSGEVKKKCVESVQDSSEEVNSPDDVDKANKGKKGKEPAKGKKAVGKKVSPSGGRQGVLTNFFKRS